MEVISRGQEDKLEIIDWLYFRTSTFESSGTLG